MQHAAASKAKLAQASGRLSHGVTLLEMLIVLMVLAIVGAIAAPSFAPANQQILMVAAEQAAEALRFARLESMRTGIPHGLTADIDNDQYRVFRLDLSDDPAVPVFDVYHPTDKQLYQHEENAGVTISRYDLNFITHCHESDALVFNAIGAPICGDPFTAHVGSAQLQFNLGGDFRTIVVIPVTGRVIVQ